MWFFKKKPNEDLMKVLAAITVIVKILYDKQLTDTDKVIKAKQIVGIVVDELCKGHKIEVKEGK